MLPIGPLMIEHRLIERMIRLLAQETTRIKNNIAVNPYFAFVEVRFLDATVDFLRTYADQMHHGKEEDILFAALQEKSLSPAHLALMEELQQEHIWGRQATASLEAARARLTPGNPEALPDLLHWMSALAEFYPRHIAKEDNHFFLPVMAYFSAAEKSALLARLTEFDNAFNLEKYQKIVADWEACGCKCHL